MIRIGEKVQALFELLCCCCGMDAEGIGYGVELDEGENDRNGCGRDGGIVVECPCN